MPQSLVQIHVHVVFSTHDRTPWLADLQQRTHLHRYMHGICRNLGSPAIRINGPADHVHAACLLGKQQCPADLVRDLKRSATQWVADTYPELTGFHWQRGYGAFSICAEGLPEVLRYIEDQEEHHRAFSFQDEFRRICKKAGLVIDERYVWE